MWIGILILIVAFSGVAEAASPSLSVTGELQRWHKITLECSGPDTNEAATPNPFVDYRLDVEFEHSATNKTYRIPGYYAADGDAANTSADSGNRWLVHFAPDEIGEWTYQMSFQNGRFLSVSDPTLKGKSAGPLDGATGTFTVAESGKTGRDFRARGRLQYVGEHFLQFAGTGEYFLKCGVDAPENLLAYEDFDGDFKSDGHKDTLVKTWEPHLSDWKHGDPTWGDGKGRALIGAINYLASKGLNAASFLTLNIQGDDCNVFPYTNYDERLRFDVSKLAQWEVVFEHAQRQGIFLHFKTQEHENQGLLDGGGVGLQRKLYYRELIARFGHHLALNWNLGEESGQWGKQVTLGQDSVNRRAMAEYFHNHDPYHHLVVIHNGIPFNDMLGDLSKLTGVSVQTNRTDFSIVHGAILKWRSASAMAGKPWVVSCDEPGDAQHALITDEEDPEHDQARINGLWGTLMAGGAGIEWYFGYAHPHSDLTCQDWRSRDRMWDQCRHAMDFFTGRVSDADGPIPLHKLVPSDSLVSGSNYCMHLGDRLWLVYIKAGGSAQLDVGDASASFHTKWFNPRRGTLGERISNQPPDAQGELTLKAPDRRDWLAVVRMRK